jgi:hypothetical protein
MRRIGVDLHKSNFVAMTTKLKKTWGTPRSRATDRHRQRKRGKVDWKIS